MLRLQKLHHAWKKASNHSYEYHHRNASTFGLVLPYNTVLPLSTWYSFDTCYQWVSVSWRPLQNKEFIDMCDGCSILFRGRRFRQLTCILMYFMRVSLPLALTHKGPTLYVSFYYIVLPKDTFWTWRIAQGVKECKTWNRENPKNFTTCEKRQKHGSAEPTRPAARRRLRHFGCWTCASWECSREIKGVEKLKTFALVCPLEYGQITDLKTFQHREMSEVACTQVPNRASSTLQDSVFSSLPWDSWRTQNTPELTQRSSTVSESRLHCISKGAWFWTRLSWLGQRRSGKATSRKAIPSHLPRP